MVGPDTTSEVELGEAGTPWCASRRLPQDATGLACDRLWVTRVGAFRANWLTAGTDLLHAIRR